MRNNNIFKKIGFIFFISVLIIGVFLSLFIYHYGYPNPEVIHYKADELKNNTSVTYIEMYDAYKYIIENQKELLSENSSNDFLYIEGRNYYNIESPYAHYEIRNERIKFGTSNKVIHKKTDL